MQMSIELVTLSNLNIVTPLFDAYRVFYNQESNIPACHKFLKVLIEGRKNHMWMVINAQQHPMGFVNLYPSYTSVGMAPVFILNDLYVDPKNRKSGVGTILVEHAVKWAKSRGAIRLHLETGNENTSAQKLYEGMGWKKEKDTLFYYLPLT
ncbi:MAG: GNAT superfamily N-acetyltransferase [Saprospiraceae bacterium]|jgi:GNAT superfamily N-acetyltransferase